MSSKDTANKALDVLVSKNKGFRVLKGPEKNSLAIALMRKNMVVYGQAYDIVRCKKKIDFLDEKDVEKNLDHITIYEVKGTNQKNMKSDFSKYFFDLTTAELLVAQSLKKHFKFVFVNTITKEYKEYTLTQVFAKAKGIYPKWAIRF